MERFGEFVDMMIKGFLLVTALYSLGFITVVIFSGIVKFLNYFKIKKY